MKITLTEDPTVIDALDIVFGYAIKQKQMTVDESEFLKNKNSLMALSRTTTPT